MGIGPAFRQRAQLDLHAGLMDPVLEGIQNAFHQGLNIHIRWIAQLSGFDQKVRDVSQFGDVRGKIGPFGPIDSLLDM